MKAPFPRRQFLTTAALAAGAAAFPSQPSSAGQFTGKIRKATKFAMVDEELTVTDKFKLLKDLGFDGTEISTRDKVDPAEVEKAIETTGLPVHGVVNSSDPDLPAAIDLSKRLGGTSVLFVCRYDKSVSLMENWKRDQELLKQHADYAAEQGIHLLVENVWASYLISAFDVRNFLDEVNHPSVGSYFDVGNNVRWGVPEHWIQILGNRIHKLDIKEFNTQVQMDVGLRTALRDSEIGEGSIDWAAVRQQLAAINFNGWATAEVRGGDRERLADIAARMDRVLGLV